jgi:hypothetical protein
VSRFPTLEAELGYAVARGRLTPALAHVVILARYKDSDEALRRAEEMHHSAAVWRHISDQLRLRVRELTTANARARLPWNVLMAQAHEINRSQTLDEPEVTAIVEDTVYDSLPDRRRNNGAGR